LDDFLVNVRGVGARYLHQPLLAGLPFNTRLVGELLNINSSPAGINLPPSWP
jgi:hypothetical protein